MLILAIFWGAIKLVGHNYDKGPEKEQEAWRQEQIALTGSDPCEATFEAERRRRHRQELVDSGQMNDGELLTQLIQDHSHEGMTFEEKRAQQDHALEMYQKCPPLNFVESLDDPHN